MLTVTTHDGSRDWLGGWILSLEAKWYTAIRLCLKACKGDVLLLKVDAIWLVDAREHRQSFKLGTSVQRP